jgi:hypothetical protein
VKTEIEAYGDRNEYGEERAGDESMSAVCPGCHST